MAYVTIEKVEIKLGQEDLISASDRDADGLSDTAAVQAAIDEAASWIDTYLAKVVDLPLQNPPAVLERWNMDVAIYLVAENLGAATKEYRLRRDDVFKELEKIAAGKLALPIPLPPPVESQDDVEFLAYPREFTREQTRGMGG